MKKSFLIFLLLPATLAALCIPKDKPMQAQTFYFLTNGSCVPVPQATLPPTTNPAACSGGMTCCAKGYTGFSYNGISYYPAGTLIVQTFKMP